MQTEKQLKKKKDSFLLRIYRFDIDFPFQRITPLWKKSDYVTSD